MGNEAKQARLLGDLLSIQAADTVTDGEATEFDRCAVVADDYDRPLLEKRLRSMIRRRNAADSLWATLVRIRRPAVITLVCLLAAGIVYAQGYVPAGYALGNVKGEQVKTVFYSNGAGDSIIIEQSASELNISSDAEAERREVTLKGAAAYLITGKGQTILTWERDGVPLKLITA